MILAHAWLFKADLNPHRISADGMDLVESLARAFDSIETKVKRDSAQESGVRTKLPVVRPPPPNRPTTVTKTFVRKKALQLVDVEDDCPTGRYKREEIDELLKKANGKR